MRWFDPAVWLVLAGILLYFCWEILLNSFSLLSLFSMIFHPDALNIIPQIFTNWQSIWSLVYPILLGIGIFFLGRFLFREISQKTTPGLGVYFQLVAILWVLSIIAPAGGWLGGTAIGNLGGQPNSLDQFQSIVIRMAIFSLWGIYAGRWWPEYKASILFALFTPPVAGSILQAVLSYSVTFIPMSTMGEFYTSGPFNAFVLVFSLLTFPITLSSVSSIFPYILTNIFSPLAGLYLTTQWRKKNHVLVGLLVITIIVKSSFSYSREELKNIDELALNACWNNNTSELEHLLELGEIDKDKLNSCISHANEKTLQTLIQHGMNTDSREGEMSLIAAAGEGRAETVDTLIKAGADVNAKDENGNTALLQAITEGADRIRHDYKDEDSDYSKVVKSLIKAGANVNIENNAGYSPVIMASLIGNNDFLSLLLNAGGNPNKTDNRDKCSDCSMSFYSIYSPDEEWLRDVAETTGHPGHIGDIGLTIGPHQGTALMWAAYFGNYDGVNLLLAKGADVNRKDAYGSTALMWGAYSGFEPLINSLLDSGARTKAVDNYGNTPLHYLAYGGASQAQEKDTEEIYKAFNEAFQKGEIKDPDPMNLYARLLVIKDSPNKGGKTALAYAEDSGQSFLAMVMRKKHQATQAEKCTIFNKTISKRDPFLTKVYDTIKENYKGPQTSQKKAIISFAFVQHPNPCLVQGSLVSCSDEDIKKINEYEPKKSSDYDATGIIEGYGFMGSTHSPITRMVFAGFKQRSLKPELDSAAVEAVASIAHDYKNPLQRLKIPNQYLWNKTCFYIAFPLEEN